MVKHAEDLVKGQPRVIGLSRMGVGGLPLVFEVPKLGGSAEMKKGRRETGVRETDRQRLTATVVTCLTHHTFTTSSGWRVGVAQALGKGPFESLFLPLLARASLPHPLSAAPAL